MDKLCYLHPGPLSWLQHLRVRQAGPQTLRPVLWEGLVPSAGACSDHWLHVRHLGESVSGVGLVFRVLTVVKHDCSLCGIYSLPKRKDRGQDSRRARRSRLAVGCACRDQSRERPYLSHHSHRKHLPSSCVLKSGNLQAARNPS